MKVYHHMGVFKIIIRITIQRWELLLRFHLIEKLLRGDLIVLSM